MLKIPGKQEGAKWNPPPIFIDELNYRGDGAGYLKPGKTQVFTLGIDGGTPEDIEKRLEQMKIRHKNRQADIDRRYLNDQPT